MQQRDPHQANHVLRAYRYQLLHALQSWLDLRADQELLLEIDEDHAIVAHDHAESTQVKFTQPSDSTRSLSLRSAGVIQAIQRYWSRSNAGQDPRPNLKFLTNAGAAREHGSHFPENRPGLLHWRNVARTGDLASIRRLLSEIFAGTPLGSWLETTPTDAELRSRLLLRVDFVLNAPDDAALEAHIHEQLGILYLAKRNFATLADTALPFLHYRVFAVASDPKVAERRLTQTQLHRALEEAIPRIGAHLAVDSNNAPPATGFAVTPLRLRPGLASRSAAILQSAERIAGSPVVWFYGANGVGKSTFGALVARHLGGSWITADFRPYQTNDDARGAIAAWHELITALAIGSPPDGLIVDDISPRAIELLKSRLAGLFASSKIRHAKIIVISNHSPPATLLTELCLPSEAAIEVPYLNVEDVRELVQQPPAPEKPMIEGWTRLIHLSTASGHPLLVMAKIANLRSRQWPDEALLEDIGPQANEAVQDTRAHARRRLLAELPAQSTARAVLERASTVFQSFEDGLVHQLCHDPPAVAHPADALTMLKGSWIEPAPDGGWRLSPLIADLHTDVPAAQIRRWRQVAATYWLGRQTLDARTLPLCFWNAYLGRHLFALQRVSEAILRLPSGQLQAAASTLSPLVVMSTTQSLLPEEPMTGCMLRHLQIVVADAVEDEAVAISAARTMLSEIDNAPVPQFRELQISVVAKSVLWLDRVWIPPALQLAYLLRLRSMVARVMDGSFPELRDITTRLLRGLPPGADPAGALLASSFLRVRDSARLRQWIDALHELQPEPRTALLRSVEAVLGDLGSYFHNGWANEQILGLNLAPALEAYGHMRGRVAHWGDPALEAQFAIAESVILDEGLNHTDQALTAIDAALHQFGKTPALLRQKGKVLAHRGSHAEAAALLLDMEKDVAALPAFDRPLVLRDAGVACARAHRNDDALRLFRKAATAVGSGSGRDAMKAGLLVDEAMVLWDSGKSVEALQRVGDALDAVESFDPTATRQNQRAHQAACAVVGLFLHDVEHFPRAPRPEIHPGFGSQLESSDPPKAVAVPSLADNWRMLELLELEANLDAGIAPRSAPKQTTLRVLKIEGGMATACFSAALFQRDLDAAVLSILPAVSILRLIKHHREDIHRCAPALFRVELSELAPSSLDYLLADNWQPSLEHAILDIMLMWTITGAWTDSTADQLHAAVTTHWGQAAILHPLIATAMDAARVDRTSSLPTLIASTLRTVVEGDLGPSDRLGRDLYWTYQVTNSIGRHALEPLVANRIVRGWRRVIDHQSFALTAPSRHRPDIETGIRAIEANGLRAAPLLFAAASPSTRFDLSPWATFLNALAAPVTP